MGVDKLPPKKRREIAIGEVFLCSYNRTSSKKYQLDESYWDMDPNREPDLKFIGENLPDLFAEVVGFDENGVEGFIRKFFQSSMLQNLQYSLTEKGGIGFNVWVTLSEIPKNSRQRAYLASNLARIAVEKAADIREKHFHWERQEVKANWSTLFGKLSRMSVMLKNGGPAGCMVGGEGRVIEPIQGLLEALGKKELNRYGGNTHLLIDNQSPVVGCEDLLRTLDGKLLPLEGYEGVWFVTDRDSSVVPLHKFN